MLSGCFNINLLPIFQSPAVQSQSIHPYTPLIEAVQLLVLGVYNRLLKTCFKEKYGGRPPDFHQHKQFKKTAV